MHAVFYRGADGHEPVSDFLNELPPAVQAALVLQIERLNMLKSTDPSLPFPHSSQIEGELRELRCHYGRRLFRILFRRCAHLFVLLHIFEKVTGAVPEVDKQVARERLSATDG